MTKKMLMGATAAVTLMVVAFFKDPEAGQAVLMSLFEWVWPW